MGSVNYDYRVKILAWLDGDTCDVAIDLGFAVGITQRVRVYGINAPEVHSLNPAEKKAGGAARDFAAGLAPVGGQILARSFKHGANDKFGRFLAVLTLADGSDLAAKMIAAGHAKAYFGDKKEPFDG